MTCAGCGHENRAGRKFCAECGAALALACAACGTINEPGEKFCGECGAALATPAPVSAPPATSGAPPLRAAVDTGARKVVTVVFADLVGSTALHERLDAESAQRVMARYYEALREVVAAHGGTVVKLLGDGVMAAFGLRRVAEDDAIRAIRAAVAMQEAFRELVRTDGAAFAGAGLRVGVNTGEVVVSDALDDVIGDPVNVAARLQEQGRDGDVVVGEATRRLVATRVTLVPLGTIALKGRTEAVAAHRVESLEPPPTATAAPFVGREDELARLRAVYAAAVAAPGTRLAVLLGSPGLGKSRSIEELGRGLGDAATVLAGHCDATGGATFAPLVTALHAHLGGDAAATPDALRAAVEGALPADDPERGRVAAGIAALLAGSPAAPEETFFVVRRLLAALARARPVVLAIDDLHWAEPLLLDLVEHLVQWGAGVPLFVLIGARPELRDLRSSLVTPGGLVSDVVTLGGLDAGAATRLAANVIGAADLPAAVAAQVLATTEGNPLFVGELVRMLVQEGALAKHGDRWVAGAGLAAIAMPPTIHALLAARIERLRPEDRTVLERASVVGRHFSRGAVAALLGANGAELDARLESLRRSELIERDAGWLLGEPVMRFHHVLIRDAAYRRLLKGTRAELHERLADWMERRVGDAPEHDETVGWHLEQAHQHLRELGPLDAHARTLGERAATRLAAAGRRALGRDDVPLAAGLLGRAIDRLDADAAGRAELALDWCEALLSAGDVGPATAAIADLARLAEHSERLRGWHTCFAAQLAVMTAPEELHAAAERVAVAARDLAARNDAAGEAKAHFVHAQALARLGKVGGCEAALDLALAAARRADDRRRANAVLAGAPLAALWGPSPVTRASGRCLDVVRVLRITQGAPAVEAVALSCQGVLEALRGRTEAARRMLASSRAMVEELGITQRLHEVDVFIARVDLLEGDAAAAERRLRPAYDGLRELGLGSDAARAAALLGRALLSQDRAAEAERLSHESELLAGDDIQAAIAWRGVRAEALAARGEHGMAIELAEAAVAVAAATDALLDHADARTALAATLRAAGRTADAASEARHARDLWETKGATTPLARAGHPATPSTQIGAGTAPLGDTPSERRRVRSNPAADAIQRFAAAFAARDATTLERLFTDDLEVVDHLNGATYGRTGHLDSVARLQRRSDAILEIEPLATLGEHLVLGHRRIRASGTTGGRFDVGPFERDEHIVVEVDPAGRIRRLEILSAARLGDAIVTLYQRHAERLPAGPARTRAAAVATSFAALTTEPGLDRIASALAPTLVSVDHRPLGFWSAQSADEWLRHVGAHLDLATVTAPCDEDVLALVADAVLVRRVYPGSIHASGGAFENATLALFAFGADGLATRIEWFDHDQHAAALARFDAITTESAQPSPASRRVRPNMATAIADRTATAIESGAAGATIAALFAATFEEIDHPTGSTNGRDAAVASIERLMRSTDVRYGTEPLATLGPALALIRRRIRASGARGHHFDVGEYANEALSLHEVDAAGRHLRHEVFAPEHLGAAVAALYRRHAERLHGTDEHARAATIARSVPLLDGPIDLEHLASSVAPSFECVDHRSLGTWSAGGPAEWVAHFRAQADLTEDFAVRTDEILGLGADWYLVRQTYFGRDRTGGGHFENVILGLYRFGRDGLLVSADAFEPEQDAAALARFDALDAEDGRGPRGADVSSFFANAATRFNERFVAAWRARDWNAIAALHDMAGRVDDRRRFMQIQGGRDLNLAALRVYFETPRSRWEISPIATRGERLALSRLLYEANVDQEGGALAIDFLAVDEVGSNGHSIALVIFDLDDLDAAYAELDRRFDAGDGAELARVAIEVATAVATRDWQASTIVVRASGFVARDHRPRAGVDTTRGHEACGHGPDSLCRPLHVRRHARGFLWQCSGERGRYETPLLGVAELDDQRRLASVDIYEPRQIDAARARFEELAEHARVPRRAHRRTRPNAASETAVAIESALARKDLAAIDALLADPMTTTEHLTGTTYGRDGMLESCSRMMCLPALDCRIEPLATLGDSFCLERRIVTASGTELESYIVQAVDAAGRLTVSDVFASDRLLDATARLQARFAESLPEGPERTRAEGIARTLAAEIGPLDPERVAEVYDPSFVCIDHRTLGTWSSETPEDWLRHWRGQSDLAAGFTRRDDDILAFSPAATVSRHTYFGTSRASGGSFENVFAAVNVYGADGRYTRSELFEPDQADAALARFDALVAGCDEAPRLPSAYFANAATRFNDRFVTAWRARDWDGIAALYDPTGTIEDRRRLLQMEGSYAGAGGGFRAYFEMPRSRWVVTPIATRGERLALSRLVLEGDVDSDGGPFAIDFLAIDEVGTDGRSIAIVLFDPGDLDAAYGELDRRWEAGDGAVAVGPATAAFERAFADRDWAAVRTLCAATFVEHDHRPITGLGTTQGRDTWVEKNLRIWKDLAPDTVLRRTDLRACAGGSLTRGVLIGSRDGGRFELPLVVVAEADAAGLVVRADVYDESQLAAAFARFAAIRDERSASSLEPFANAASRSFREFQRCWRARDWVGVHATYHPAHQMDDRRRLVRLAVAGETFFANERLLFDDTASDWHGELLATSGERLALFRVRFTATVGASGPMEVEMLDLVEVDAVGRRTALVVFDPDDEDAAWTELDARYAAGAPMQAIHVAFGRAFASRDWKAIAALCAPTFVEHDHRPITGVGTTRGRDAWVQKNLRIWTDLAPDAAMQRTDTRACARGALSRGVLQGTRDGGRFELPLVLVAEIDASGLLVRSDVYDDDQLDAAWNRFAELAAPGTTTARSANAVTKAMDRWAAAYDVACATDDWTPMRALCAPDMVFEDRQRFALVAGDRNLMIASARERMTVNARPQRRLVAMCGDRVTREHVLWSGGPPDGRFEIEHLAVIEADAAGLLSAIVLFALDDTRSARREGWRRWSAVDPAAAPWLRIVGETIEAIEARDRPRLRAVFADDLVVDDHRRSGLGRIVGPDAWLDAITGPPDCVVEGHVDCPFWPVIAPHGVVTTLRRSGFAGDEHLWLILASAGRITRMEMFEHEQLAAATARLAELRPDPLSIPPNAATRAYDRWCRTCEAGDPDVLRAVYAPDFVFDDRRRLMHLTADSEMTMANARHLFESGWRPTRTALASAGERLSLGRVLWTLGEAEDVSEVEILEVDEVDPEGRFVASIVFDADDHAAASAELLERYVASGGDVVVSVALDAVRAWNGHDVERLRALFPPDFYLDDRRHTGVGRLEDRDAYLASLAALWELSRDVMLEPLYVVAVADHGRLYVCRWFGTNAEGGGFDAVSVCLALAREGRPAGLEMYELDELDAARARFEALRPAPAPGTRG